MVKGSQEDENAARDERDRALFLIEFVISAMRRSELCRMEVDDLNFVIEGLEILIP